MSGSVVGLGNWETSSLLRTDRFIVSVVWYLFKNLSVFPNSKKRFPVPFKKLLSFIGFTRQACLSSIPSILHNEMISSISKLVRFQNLSRVAVKAISCHTAVSSIHGICDSLTPYRLAPLRRFSSTAQPRVSLSSGNEGDFVFAQTAYKFDVFWFVLAWRLGNHCVLQWSGEPLRLARQARSHNRRSVPSTPQSFIFMAERSR